jgi:hypothetical protein
MTGDEKNDPTFPDGDPVGAVLAGDLRVDKIDPHQ